MGDADMSTIISILGLTALMFAPVIAVLVLPTADKSNDKLRREWITQGSED